MPNQTVPDNATPAANQGAEMQGSEVGSLEALTAFIARNEARPTETDSEQQPAAAEADHAPSQIETASDGAEGEAESGKLKDESPETAAASEPDASAEEQAAEPEAGAKAPDPDSEDALEEWLATLPKGAARKLRAQHRQIAELKRELADRAKQPEVTSQVSPSAPVVLPDRLEHISDLRELEKVEAKSRDSLRSAERALDAVDDLREALDANPDEVVRQLKAAKYEPPEDREGLVKFLGEIKRGIRAERVKASEALDAVPRRRSHLEQEARVVEQAAADYPWLKTKEGDDYQLFEQVIKARPQVRQMGPDWAFTAAVFVEGLKALNARRAAKAKAAPVAAKAAAAPPPKQPSRSATPRVAAGSAARSRFEETGSVEDLAAAIAAAQ